MLLIAGVPAATLLDLPVAPLLGEEFTFTARFENASPTDPGYGPYLDLYLPLTGKGGAGAAEDDGIDFVGATYWGVPVTFAEVTLTDTGVPHPFAMDITGAPILILPPDGFQAGDKLVVLHVPFDRFTYDQPPADITVTVVLSEKADVDQPLPLLAVAGFQLGEDPLNNPTSDPSVIGLDSSGEIRPSAPPQKWIVATSEPSTAGASVAIGEIVRYRLAVQIPEGDATGTLQIADALPAGLTFLDNGSATVAFVANGGGIDSSTLSGAGLDVTGNSPSISPTFALPAGAIVGSPFVSGTDVTFNLGSLVNNDHDTDVEYAVVEFNALVDNRGGGPVDSNDAGDVLANTFAPRRNGVLVGGSSNAVALTVVEPVLAIAKDVIATTGAVVTYRVTLTNTGSATAFEAHLEDPLPASLDLGTVTAASFGGAMGAVDGSSGNTLAVDVASIPVGGGVTVTYTANVVSDGVAITNVAHIQYTTLPGKGTLGNPTGSNTPGDSGDIDGERNAEGGINDLAAEDSARLAALGDRVWYDVDGDGVQDVGELGIPGVELTVRWAGLDGVFDSGDDSVIATATANGLYLVSGLPVGGQYRVSVNPATLPSGLTSQTFDRDGVGSAHQVELTLAPGSPDPRDVDFGYRGMAALGDRVWNDMDGDTHQDGNEPGIPAIGITATWAGFDGIFGTGDELTYHATTGAAGNYGMEHLPAGLFAVDVDDATLPANLALTTPVLEPESVVLGIAQTNDTLDFGYVGNAALGDTVWYDVDASGTQNHAEPGIAGVTVTLLFGGRDGDLATAGDNITYTAPTDVLGRYSFAGLPVGEIHGGNANYHISTANVPASYPVLTYDLDGVGSANTASLQLAAGQHRVDGDFGYRGTGLLGDRLFDDRDGGGVQDGGEPGIVGVILQLLDASGMNWLAVTTTGVDGLYSFTGLAAGTYVVRVVMATLPAGYQPTFDLDGTLDHRTTVSLLEGQTPTDVDFGYQEQDAVISDYVWHDSDGDGVQDGTETGMGGVRVYLDVNGNNQYDSGERAATTNGSGIYSISGLPAGSYRVRVDTTTLPSGYAATYDLDGARDHAASVALSAGQVRADVDFGYGLHPPVAADDSSSNNVPGPVTLNVTANDSDPDDDLAAGTVDLDPSVPGRQTTFDVPGEGIWSVADSGAVTFTPVAGVTWDPMPLAYTVSDSVGLVSNIATILVDYRPVATSNSSTGNTAGTPVTLDVVADDFGGDMPDPSSVQLLGTAQPGDSLVVAGEGTWSINPVTGEITFTPQPGFTDDPRPRYYTVKDYQGNVSNTATVAVDYVQTCVGHPFTLIVDDPSTPQVDVIIVDDAPLGTMTARGASNTLDLLGTTPGRIYFNGAVGSFSLNRITAKSKPLVGTAEEPEITLDAVNRNSGPGSLVIEATDGCCRIASAGTHQFTSPIGSVANGTVGFQETLDLANTSFGQGPGANALTNQLGPFFAGSISSQKSQAFTLAAPTYVSLTKRITLTHTGSNKLTTLSAGGLVTAAETQTASVADRGSLAGPQTAIAAGRPAPAARGWGGLGGDSGEVAGSESPARRRGEGATDLVLAGLKSAVRLPATPVQCSDEAADAVFSAFAVPSRKSRSTLRPFSEFLAE